MTVDESVETSPADINKGAAIRRAFQFLPADSKPSEVVAYLKRELDLDVSIAYVGAIKGEIMKRVSCQTFEAIRLARKLIKETGSPENARFALDAVQDEIDRTASLRSLYENQLTEVTLRLEDTERPLENREKTELRTEKKRIEALLKALGDL